MNPKKKFYLFVGVLTAISAVILARGIQQGAGESMAAGSVLLVLCLLLVVLTVRNRMSPEELEVRRAALAEARQSSPRTLRWGPWGYGALAVVGMGMLVEDIVQGDARGALLRDALLLIVWVSMLRRVLGERRQRAGEGKQQ